jgi:hypothetical protein
MDSYKGSFEAIVDKIYPLWMPFITFKIEAQFVKAQKTIS